MNNHAENKSMWTNPESSSQMPCHNAPINKSAYFSYTDNRVMHIDQYIKQKLENLLDHKVGKNDASVRPSHLSSALRDPNIWPPDPKADRFMPLPRGLLVPTCISICLFIFKMSCSQVWQQRNKWLVNKQTDKPTDEWMDSLRHNASICQSANNVSQCLI